MINLFLLKDVKEVITWATSGNADVGFVYLSDTLNNDNVKLLNRFLVITLSYYLSCCDNKE